MYDPIDPLRSLSPLETSLVSLSTPPGSEAFEQRSWLSVPAGGTISMTTVTGCEVFVKEGEWRPPAEQA